MEYLDDMNEELRGKVKPLSEKEEAKSGCVKAELTGTVESMGADEQLGREGAMGRGRRGPSKSRARGR